jgi:hypothetical protein
VSRLIALLARFGGFLERVDLDLLLRFSPALFYGQAMYALFVRHNDLEAVLWMLGTLLAWIAVEVRRFRLAAESAVQQITVRSTDVPG